MKFVCLFKVEACLESAQVQGSLNIVDSILFQDKARVESTQKALSPLIYAGDIVNKSDFTLKMVARIFHLR